MYGVIIGVLDVEDWIFGIVLEVIFIVWDVIRVLFFWDDSCFLDLFLWEFFLVFCYGLVFEIGFFFVGILVFILVIVLFNW